MPPRSQHSRKGSALLQDARVLDLTRFVAGPYCTLMLSDIGADVVKVEALPAGDWTRTLEPRAADGGSHTFNQLNRGKRSIGLDYKSSEGMGLLHRLIASSDIVVENFRPGLAGRMGISYDDLAVSHPQLVFCSITGYGQTGPLHNEPAVDLVMQGMTGYMSMTGSSPAEPARIGFAVTDLLAGTKAAFAILAAYIERLNSGIGQHVDIAMFDAALSWTVLEAAAFFGAGEEPVPTGTRHRRTAPYQAYMAADGHLVVGAATDDMWQRFCREVVNRPKWLEDERFISAADRVRNVAQLEAAIETVFSTRPRSHWLERLQQSGIPAGPVNSYAQALSHPQVLARGMVSEVADPISGPHKLLGAPYKFSRSGTKRPVPAPRLGDSTREIAHELGYSDSEIDVLGTMGAIALP